MKKQVLEAELSVRCRNRCRAVAAVRCTLHSADLSLPEWQLICEGFCSSASWTCATNSAKCSATLRRWPVKSVKINCDGATHNIGETQ